MNNTGSQSCLESIRKTTYHYYSLKGKSAKYAQLYNTWQSCLEVAEEIYHSDAPDAEERIKALKLAIL